jgi:hypothetical protein
MKLLRTINVKQIPIICLMAFFFFPARIYAQERISIGLHFDPLISWFGTDINAVKNNGARPGINAGLTFNLSFSPNYSFSTGLNLISAGGRLISEDSTQLELVYYKDKIATVEAGEAVVYKTQYVSIPLGLKLKTNQIGYLTFFSDVGVDPKMLVGGKVDIPSLEVDGEKATSELKLFNLSYHIMAGIEYALGGSTSVVFGIGFENNFLDVTKDNGIQPADIVTHKLVSIRFGVNF